MPKLKALVRTFEAQFGELQDTKDEYKETVSELELHKARLEKQILTLEDKVSEGMRRVKSHEDFDPDTHELHWDDETGEVELRPKEDENDG